MRYNIPVLAVALNDQALGSEYHKMLARNLKAGLSVIPTPDIGAVADAYGGRSRLARSVEELDAAVGAWLANPGPMIIDVRISRNVQTVSTRRLLYGRND